MSMVMNKGVKKGCKGVSANLFAILCILVEPSTAISEKKGYIEEYTATLQPSITVTSSSLVIPPSIPSPLFYSSMELFQIQIRIAFPFLHAKGLHTSLLIMRTCSFLLFFT